MPWNFSSERPIYLQLTEHLKLLILSGKYSIGDRFPSVRELASEASVNPNTMQKALVQLEQEGLLINGRTTGRTVTTDDSLIKLTKEQMALDLFNDFRFSLMNLGFTPEETKAFILKEFEKKE